MAESMSPIKLQLWGCIMIYQAEVISAICQLQLVDLVVAVTCIPTLWSLWMLHPVLRHPVLLMAYISIYQWYIN
jgi:hypothetical protein